MPDPFKIENSARFSVSASYANFGVFAPKSNFEHSHWPNKKFKPTLGEQTLNFRYLKVGSVFSFELKNAISMFCLQHYTTLFSLSTTPINHYPVVGTSTPGVPTLLLLLFFFSSPSSYSCSSSSSYCSYCSYPLT